mmetsp:Transcript_63373/g.98613  ORF Transcript_63373/g.98613 Transcript_63373/m.98613 type:complete len:239 (-) Transcript_63373:227-943(-)
MEFSTPCRRKRRVTTDEDWPACTPDNPLHCRTPMESVEPTDKAGHLKEAAKLADLPTCSNEANTECVVIFVPGALGFTVDDAVDKAAVRNVIQGSQAHRQGVKAGWRIVAVGDQTCDSFFDRLFQDAKNGQAPYRVTFKKAAEVLVTKVDGEKIEFAYDGNVYRVKDRDAFDKLISSPLLPPRRSVGDIMRAQRVAREACQTAPACRKGPDLSALHVESSRVRALYAQTSSSIAEELA